MATIAPPYRPFSPSLPPIDTPHRHGGSAVAVTLRYAPLAFLLRRRTPVLEIDGQGVPAHWGRVVQSVTIGEHHVHVHVPRPAKVSARGGAAETTVIALSGRTVELEYRAPLLSLLGGAIGVPPQRHPGVIGAWILLATVAVLVACGCVGLIMNAG
ncbi:hypothetical protein [Actinoplanes derwentensis]|uniref:Uncharacterized protein n=1 Tax=Actinoplanes derwentensis TaxID=113562 RepID=A0A1H2AGW2_9ACTN|nr:hypothetical protein [Actinoplanes derwentensis]GID90256.1 hypothetical protein Ade03nite_91800 [Actinoplanes derwentensis]SDT45180.1 hypothetical protein SAMN04489716_3859 [Actinoplanes derwentensis]